MQALEKTEFGDPILRKVARPLTQKEIGSDKIQRLIKSMHYTLTHKKFGVGLAAPQIGESIALVVIEVQPTEYRPNLERFSATLINPKITKTYGKKIPMYEGCLSSGAEPLMAKVPRYKKVEVQYIDENGDEQKTVFEDMAAHVAQHEIDHINGILFVDKVEDPKTYISFKEYKKLVESNHDEDRTEA